MSKDIPVPAKTLRKAVSERVLSKRNIDFESVLRDFPDSSVASDVRDCIFYYRNQVSLTISRSHLLLSIRLTISRKAKIRKFANNTFRGDVFRWRKCFTRIKNEVAISMYMALIIKCTFLNVNPMWTHLNEDKSLHGKVLAILEMVINPTNDRIRFPAIFACPMKIRFFQVT